MDCSQMLVAIILSIETFSPGATFHPAEVLLRLCRQRLRMHCHDVPPKLYDRLVAVRAAGNIPSASVLRAPGAQSGSTYIQQEPFRIMGAKLTLLLRGQSIRRRRRWRYAHQGQADICTANE